MNPAKLVLLAIFDWGRVTNSVGIRWRIASLPNTLSHRPSEPEANEGSVG